MAEVSIFLHSSLLTSMEVPFSVYILRIRLAVQARRAELGGLHHCDVARNDMLGMFSACKKFGPGICQWLLGPAIILHNGIQQKVASIEHRDIRFCDKTRDPFVQVALSAWCRCATDSCPEFGAQAPLLVEPPRCRWLELPRAITTQGRTKPQVSIWAGAAPQSCISMLDRNASNDSRNCLSGVTRALTSAVW